MLYSGQFILPAALREYVHSIHIADVDFTLPNAPPRSCTLMPRPMGSLSFCLGDPIKVKTKAGEFVSLPGAIIGGPKTGPVTIEFGQRHSFIYIGFRPGGLYRLLGTPLDQFVDQNVDAHRFLGAEADEVYFRLLASKNNVEKSEIVQQYLLGKLPLLKPMLPFDSAINELVEAGGNLPVDYVAAQSCLSTRQFERQARIRLGLSPKLYARIVRFFFAFRLKRMRPELTWTAISNTCGYFDQMHFIRDFKAFAGATPRTLRDREARPPRRKLALLNG